MPHRQTEPASEGRSTVRPKSPKDEQGNPSTAGSTPSIRHQHEYPRRLVPICSDIIQVLPDEHLFRIEINGSLAGTVLAIPDAPRELAAGWAFMYGFFDARTDVGRISVEGDRISVMVSSGVDVNRKRLETVGWVEPSSPTDVDPSRDQFTMSETDLVDLIDTSWKAFRQDGGTDGFLHVAVSSGNRISCIARDRTIDVAAAKVLGWSLLTDQEQQPSVLITRGIVGRRLVEAASRLGISVIVTSAIPTIEAYRAAAGLSLTLIGMAMSKLIGLLIDGGHIADRQV